MSQAQWWNCRRPMDRKTEEGGKAQKKVLEKPQDGRHKSSENTGNPYQMEDKKPQAGGAKRRPLWVCAEGATLLSSIW